MAEVAFGGVFLLRLRLGDVLGEGPGVLHTHAEVITIEPRRVVVNGGVTRHVRSDAQAKERGKLIALPMIGNHCSSRAVVLSSKAILENSSIYEDTTTVKTNNVSHV